jgi:hypothetical protein
LHTPIGTVGYVQFRFSLAAVDEDGVRAIKPTSRPPFPVNTAEIFPSLIVPVDIALPIAVGYPNISVAPVAFSINRHKGWAIILPLIKVKV